MDGWESEYKHRGRGWEWTQWQAPLWKGGYVGQTAVGPGTCTRCSGEGRVLLLGSKGQTHTVECTENTYGRRLTQ